MHICFLDGHYPHFDGTGGGGAGWYIKMIGEEHIKQGHKVSVLKTTPNEYRRSYIDNNGVKVIHYKTSSVFLTLLVRNSLFHFLIRPLAYILNSWTAFKMIAKINSKHKIDIIEVVDGGNFWLSISKYLPFIEHVHCSRYTIKTQCSQSIDLGTKIERMLQFVSLKNANAVISPSFEMLNIVENEYGRRLQNKRKIPLCMGKNVHNKKSNSKLTYFIFASRNDPLKGGETLIKAINLVNDNYDGITKFYFVGYEPDDDQSYPPNIVFKKFMPRNELLDFYKQCDVALLPSLFDNSPLFIYETMAAGLPVIATNVGGIPELIKHGVTGFLFNKMDYKQLSNHIINLVENTKKRKWMGYNAQSFIRKYASVERIAEKKINLYKSIIGVAK